MNRNFTIKGMSASRLVRRGLRLGLLLLLTCYLVFPAVAQKATRVQPVQSQTQKPGVRPSTAKAAQVTIPGTLKGRVLLYDYYTGKPVKNLKNLTNGDESYSMFTITAGEFSVHPDQKGDYVIKGLQPGNYTVKFKCDHCDAGFKSPESKTVAIKAGATRMLNFVVRWELL